MFEFTRLIRKKRALRKRQLEVLLSGSLGQKANIRKLRKDVVGKDGFAQVRCSLKRIFANYFFPKG